jgi:nucleoside-diphosphate-sugar epimerase
MCEMAKKTALVVGALGVVGRAMLTYLETQPDWDVIGVSRRAPDFPTKARFEQLDLTDAAACRAVLGQFQDVTHVFYCAYAPRPTFEAEVVVNLAMLKNLMAGLEPAAPRLEHVQLVHGSKWYGCHVGPYATPAREDDPRGSMPCFYFDQQDWLENHQRGKPWVWSALRPHGICGFAVGSPISQLTILAAYGSISAHLRLPLRFPGKLGAFSAVYQTTEAVFLAQAMAWIAVAPQCANEAYNVTNGDFFRWERIWPDFAAFFGIEAGPVETTDLVGSMSDKGPLWDEIRSRHGLRDYRLSDLANWNFGNWLYGCEYDIMSSTTKLRQAGWTGVVDSQAMYLRLLQELRDERIIP